MSGRSLPPYVGQPVLAPTRRREGWLRRLSWLWVLLVGTALYLLVLRTLVDTDNLNFVPSLLLLGSVVVPASVLSFATTGGRTVLVPTAVIAAVAVIGGVVGTVAAGTVEYDTLRGLGALPMFAVGLIEETAKLIVPLVVLLFTRYRGSQAGVIIGVASGMGFATLETMGYGFTALLETRSLAGLEATLQLRALLSPACHVAWTGLTAAALWAVVPAARKGRAVARLGATFLLAVVLHTAWDSSDRVAVHVVVGVVGFVALLAAIHRAHRPGMAEPIS